MNVRLADTFQEKKKSSSSNNKYFDVFLGLDRRGGRCGVHTNESGYVYHV